MMDKEIRDIWVKSLETKELPDGTKITQTKDALRAKTRGGRRPLCCLGVLCEIAVQKGVIPAPVKADDGTFEWFYEDEYGETHQHEDEDLPPAVMAWAGLIDSNPHVSFGDAFDEAALSVLNDDYEKNFKEIASMIKENL
jgi:hypothetical protein